MNLCIIKKEVLKDHLQILEEFRQRGGVTEEKARRGGRRHQAGLTGWADRRPADRTRGTGLGTAGVSHRGMKPQELTYKENSQHETERWRLTCVALAACVCWTGTLRDWHMAGGVSRCYRTHGLDKHCHTPSEHHCEPLMASR